MSVESKKSQRRYSTLELLAYVSLLCVTFAAFRLEDPPGLVGLAVICLFGALLGVGISAFLAGRKHILNGAIVGAVVLPTVLFVIFAIIVYRTHNWSRTVIDPPPGAGLKEHLNDGSDK